MSLDFAEKMMAMDLDPDHKQFARLVGIKQQVMGSVLTVMARVRAGELRPTGDDGLQELLAGTYAQSSPAEVAKAPSFEDVLN